MANFGGARSHVRSRGETDPDTLSATEQRAVEALFKAQGKVLKFDGHRRALPPAGKQEDQLLPHLEVGQGRVNLTYSLEKAK